MGPDLGIYAAMNVSLARIREYWYLGAVLFLLFQGAVVRWEPLKRAWVSPMPPEEVKARYRRIGFRAHLIALVAFGG